MTVNLQLYFCNSLTRDKNKYFIFYIMADYEKMTKIDFTEPEERRKSVFTKSGVQVMMNDVCDFDGHRVTQMKIQDPGGKVEQPSCIMLMVALCMCFPIGLYSGYWYYKASKGEF